MIKMSEETIESLRDTRAVAPLQCVATRRNISAEEYEWRLQRLRRATHRGGLIPENVGFSHINNRHDKIGTTFAFWLPKELKASP